MKKDEKQKRVLNSEEAKNILSLKSDEAMEYFLKSEQFHGFELPEYFVFDNILKFVKEKIGDKKYKECLADGKTPDSMSEVNLDILLNKDGKYAVRPLMLTNPYLYYFLVRELCSKKNWKSIKDCFDIFTVPHMKSCAIPVVPAPKEKFHKSTTILNWWNTIEQRSIELSLEYRYMFATDITNCYGSVNPQTIEWALNRKDTEHETSANTSLATNIQTYLRAMQQGRNIGIPQGSAVFDFVSEIILGYADLLLHEQIKKHNIDEPYEILRYRDDYRIFCNNKDILEQLSYILQQVLESLNFRMNSQKTKISDSLILDSIKKDKQFYIYNTPIFNKKGVDFDSFEKHLLYILMFGRQYPNGGQLKTMLSDLDKRIRQWLTPSNKKDAKKKEKPIKHPLLGGSARAMAAVCVEIALENVSCSHYALRVLSRIIESLDDETEKRDIITKTYEKMCNQPNSTYTQLWLQNITYQNDKKEGSSPYDMRLCRLVAGDTAVNLWNNSWLKPEFTKDLPVDSAVDREKLKTITPVITFRETRAYYEIDIVDEDLYDDNVIFEGDWDEL